MATPFLAQITIYAFNFAPRGFALCNGQLLPINQNQALFSLLGTTYGGNGVNNFALPELRGRAPMHWNASFPQGQVSGEETHTLLTAELPAHTHAGGGFTQSCSSGPGTSNLAAARFPAVATRPTYADAPNTSLAASSSGTTGGGQPHENRLPFLTLNFVIALQGIFPSRN